MIRIAFDQALSLAQLLDILTISSFDSGCQQISGLSIDSRSIQAGDLYIAISGSKVDGHSFLQQARDAGAVLALVDNSYQIRSELASFCLPVADVSTAMAKIVTHVLQHPADSMLSIAITGTNGKTTTNWIIHQLFQSLGLKSLRVGTLGAALNDKVLNEETLTTPNTIELNQLLARARSETANAFVVEASSIGLDQNRLAGIKLDLAIFTNLTRDHLDYHRTIEEYLSCKMKLFDLLAASNGAKIAILNADDPKYQELSKHTKRLQLNRFSFGFSEQAEFRIENYSEFKGGSSYILSSNSAALKIESPFVGKHNALNVVAAYLSLFQLGFSSQLLVKAIKELKQVPGRLERVPTDRYQIYIDYAHTPDALSNVLRTLKPICKGRLWVIFGCGGNRDPGKRAIMGEIAASLADQICITSDNPRDEEAQQIIDQILTGIKLPCLVELDRRKAIQLTILQLKPDDVLLIAGKGHENYQIIAGKKSHFSDLEEVLACLK